MKKHGILLLIITAALLAATLAGCKQSDDSVSAKERMTMFIQDWTNKDLSSLKDDTSSYAINHNTASTQAFWDTVFTGETALILTGVTGNTAIVTGSSATVYTFYLVKDGSDDYKISMIYIGSTAKFN